VFQQCLGIDERNDDVNNTFIVLTFAFKSRTKYIYNKHNDNICTAVHGRIAGRNFVGVFYPDLRWGSGKIKSSGD